MTVILAIDPGSERSAWLTYNGATGGIRSFAMTDNETLLGQFRAGVSPEIEVAVIEQMTPRGMPTSAQEFETIWWSGRFAEALHPLRVERLPRLAVKRHLCGKVTANDSNIRAALIDRYGGTGGKAKAIGLKASPGQLYGISKDVWAALAIAATWADTEGNP